jgi:hypothetical protein
MFSRERKQLLGILFGYRSCELASVDELEFRSLLGHGRGNFQHAVSDEVDRGGTGEIEILFAIGVPDVDALAAHGHGKIFTEGPAENRGPGRDRRVSHGGIIAPCPENELTVRPTFLPLWNI